MCTKLTINNATSFVKFNKGSAVRLPV